MSAMCKDCLASSIKSWHSFTAECKGCAARAVARGINYREAQAAGRQTHKYREELRLLGVSHDEVRTAATADALGVKV